MLKSNTLTPLILHSHAERGNERKYWLIILLLTYPMKYSG